MPMLAFVTGGTGFVGSNLVAALTNRGIGVRVLRRPTSSIAGLDGLEYESCVGDVLDSVDTLAAAMAGCTWVFHTAAISESVATLVDQIEHVEREQLAVGSPPEGHHLGLFGFGDVAYRPGDLLGALVAAGGPDFRCLFQLEPLSRDENTTEDLKEEWSPWREELDAEIERCLDAHMTEGFLIPDVSEARPPSAELDAGAFEQELALWATKLKRQTHKALLDNLKPLDREAAQKFEKWIERHWDQLIDQRRHPLAVAEVFGRGISDGDVKGIVRDGVVPARKKTAMQICRGDGIGPIDEKVEDPVIKEIFTSNSDLTSIMDRIIESEDPAVHIRMRFMRSSPQDMYGDEEEGVAWMQDCLRRFPDELQDEYERMKQRLAEADEEIDTARAEKVGFFKRGEHRERLAELEGNRLQVVREIQRTIVALAAVHEEQVRRCYGRARWLGAWRGLRRRLEKLSDDVTSAAANIRDAFDRAYDETSEGLARAQKRLNVGERLLRTARYAKDRVDQLVEDEYERLEASKAVVLSGRRIRGFAEGSIGTISDLLPRAIAAELPWTLSEALLKPDEDRDPSFLYDILGQLADCATSDAKVNAAAIDDSWLPLVLPFLSCEGGAKGPVAEVLGRQKMPPFFPGLSTRDSSWALLPGEDELMELRFACIGLSVEQFDRYESMSNFRDQYRQLAAELGDEAVAFGEHYDAWIDGANP